MVTPRILELEDITFGVQGGLCLFDHCASQEIRLAFGYIFYFKNSGDELRPYIQVVFLDPFWHSLQDPWLGIMRPYFKNAPRHFLVVRIVVLMNSVSSFA